MLPDLQLTTDPGLEDLALDELRALARDAGLPEPTAELRPFGLAGHLHITLDAPPDTRLALVHRMRSVHRVVRPVARFRLPATDAVAHIRAAVASLAPTIAELAPPEVRFRARCSRVGTHPFTSEDVEREAGAGVRDALPRVVSLKEHDVELRCDVRGDTCVVGVQLAGKALSRRDPGPFRPTTTLRASVAWGLLQLARPDPAAPPRSLLDPFAGAGTILLEAAARWPGVTLHGSDLHTRAVEGLRENLAAAGLPADVRLGDARQLDLLWPESTFDTIVTNPPFGRRMARQVDLDGLYRAFLVAAARRATPDARLVVLVEARGAFNRALQAARAWRTVHVRVLEMGGIYVGAFVLERMAEAQR
jgi:23S rRNA G2445 N2-methylase RlmL